MLTLGQFNELEVHSPAPFGWYLILPNSPEHKILLRTKVSSEQESNIQIGDILTVFLYKNGEKEWEAMQQKPKAIAYECASLRVTHFNRYGAFLDWGVPKDLFVPFSEQEYRMQEGHYYWVYIYIDRATERLVATANLKKFIKNRVIKVKEEQVCPISIVERNDYGFKVIVNHQHWGQIYENEIFKPLKVGQTHQGYVKKIRADGKIDVSLEAQGYKKMIDGNTQKIWDAMGTNDGFLPLTDKSHPELIYDALQMSKKNFKKAIGALYKQRLIERIDGGWKVAPNS